MKVMKRPVARLSAEEMEPLAEDSKASASAGGNGRGRGRGGRGRGRGRGQKLPEAEPQEEELWTEEMEDEWNAWRNDKAGQDTQSGQMEPKPRKARSKRRADPEPAADEPADDATELKKQKKKRTQKVEHSMDEHVPEAPAEKLTFAGRRQPAYGMPHLRWQVLRDVFAEQVAPHIHVAKWKHEALRGT